MSRRSVRPSKLQLGPRRAWGVDVRLLPGHRRVPGGAEQQRPPTAGAGSDDPAVGAARPAAGRPPRSPGDHVRGPGRGRPDRPHRRRRLRRHRHRDQLSPTTRTSAWSRPPPRSSTSTTTGSGSSTSDHPIHRRAESGHRAREPVRARPRLLGRSGNVSEVILATAPASSSRRSSVPYSHSATPLIG